MSGVEFNTIHQSGKRQIQVFFKIEPLSGSKKETLDKIERHKNTIKSSCKYKGEFNTVITNEHEMCFLEDCEIVRIKTEWF